MWCPGSSKGEQYSATGSTVAKRSVTNWGCARARLVSAATRFLLLLPLDRLDHPLISAHLLNYQKP